MRPSPLAASLLLVPFALLAEQPAARTTAHTTGPHVMSAAPADHAISLPVTRVALYKNGVGFFEHTGHVTGDLTSGQLNDVLQSLTAIDLNGGRISGAGYNSTTPLDQQLKTLPLSLDDADKSSRDRFVDELNKTEDAINATQSEVTTRTAALDAAKATLASAIDNFSIDQTI